MADRKSSGTVLGFWGHYPESASMLQTVAEERRFQLVLIKPSHYDDDGYVIRWWRAMTPSNSLAAVYGIAADCAKRQVLGPDVAIDIEVIDETNTRVDIPALLSRFATSQRVRMCRSHRRSIKSVSTRARHRASVPYSRNCGGHGRLPRVRMPIDAGWPRRGSRRLPGYGGDDIRRRGRRTLRIDARRRGRRTSRTRL